MEIIKMKLNRKTAAVISQKVLWRFQDNVENACINCTLLISVGFLYACVKFMQLKSLYQSCRLLFFFFVISCVTQINRISFILHKIYYAKGQER